MKRIWQFLSILFVFCLTGQLSSAQGQGKEARWTYTSKKIADDTYELSFNLKLNESWHVWSIDVGGDGLQIVPSFTFDEKPSITLLDEVSENGNIIETEMEGVDGIVRYFSEAVTYTQKVKAPKGSIITGVHEYQICNDHMCLPPTENKFSFTLD